MQSSSVSASASASATATASTSSSSMQNTLFQISSNTFYIFCLCIMLSVIVCIIEIKSYNKKRKLSNNYKNNNNSDMKKLQKKLLNLPPRPPTLPIIGNLAILNGYDVPYKAFSDLSEKYGSIINLQLGNVTALVVNGIDNIRDVLITKTSHFDSRPNFRRYHQLFSGNKENSLAFCDWSDLHKFRRDMLTPHTFPRNFSNQYDKLNKTIINEMNNMLKQIMMINKNDHNLTNNSNKNNYFGMIEIKPILLRSCANIFMEYFCTKRFQNNDKEFIKMIDNFDKIFYEVNQGYAADFLPFLLPLHRNNLKRMEKWSHEIRNIIIKNVIDERIKNDKNINQIQNETTEEKQLSYNDYVTGFLEHIENDLKPKLDMNTALFALEDIIGGHSAIGNFLTKVIAFIVKNPNVQKNIQIEIDTVLMRNSNDNNNINNDNDNMKTNYDDIVIDLSYKNSMHYTQAVIMEALRLIASPIVPHVSNQDTTVNGYDVEANTFIFLNNYELSMSPKLWNKPENFIPERFLKDSKLTKPDFFLPFGAGRRSCMGYKLVQLISFTIISNLLKNYTLLPVNNENYDVQIGSLAVPPERSFKIDLMKRN